MAKLDISPKRLQVNKAQATMVSIIAAAVFVAVFSLVSIKALWGQRAYQARVIDKKHKAAQQLEDNVEAVEQLVTSYKTFVSAPVNALGGNPSGNGDRDGDNARITLDALPSKYDYPALISSIEKILQEKNMTDGTISGTDDEAEQASTGQAATPEAVEMPFQISVSAPSPSIEELLLTFERSIRPIKINKLSIKTGGGKLSADITAVSYFQPEKTLNIKSVIVK